MLTEIFEIFTKSSQKMNNEYKKISKNRIFFSINTEINKQKKFLENRNILNNKKTFN